MASTSNINYNSNNYVWGGNNSSSGSGGYAYRVAFGGSAGTPTCNESKKHNCIEKACFHGMKFPYRMLGLHEDTDDSLTENPEAAVAVATEVATAYLDQVDDEYDRQESHDYYMEKIVENVIDDDSVLEKIKQKFDYFDNGISLEIFKAGIKQAWMQIEDKGHHADGCRTAIAAVEHFTGEEVDL